MLLHHNVETLSHLTLAGFLVSLELILQVRYLLLALDLESFQLMVELVIVLVKSLHFLSVLIQKYGLLSKFNFERGFFNAEFLNHTCMMIVCLILLLRPIFNESINMRLVFFSKFFKCAL